MDKALLDTDILSEIIKGKNEHVLEKSRLYIDSYDFLTTSSVSTYEILYGFHRAHKFALADAFQILLQSQQVLHFTRNDSILASKIAGELDRTGQTIGKADPMIASIAINNRLILVTGNTTHFERIIKLGYDLKIENWR